jgi:gamma-glutamyl-gamma-aminobutyrate hydrolase PuuD
MVSTHQERKRTMLPSDTQKNLQRVFTETSPHEERYTEQSMSLTQEYHPIIGIPIPVSQSDQGPLLRADAMGAWAIEHMRGSVCLIPLWPFPSHPHIYQSLWPLITSMDGLLLPAGIGTTNGSTHWQERESHPGPQTWALSWEIALAQLASFVGMPVLAIADGAEKWNVALGGRGREPLVPSKEEVSTTPEAWDRHRIRVRAKSTLATFLLPAFSPAESEQKPWELAFMPHQSVETVAPGLRSCAQAEDTSVVAVERRDAAFGLGILGRLDWGLDHVYATTLFDAFLQACRSFDRTREQNATWNSSRDAICATIAQRVEQGHPLLSAPPLPPNEKRQHPSLSKPPTGQQERIRQRSQTPTKEEWNQMRRQRLHASLR